MTRLASPSLLLALSLWLVSCAPPVTFQVQRPAELSVQPEIEYLAVGAFQTAGGSISTNDLPPLQSSLFGTKTLKPTAPTLQGFQATPETGAAIQELVRAAVVHQLSLHSPYQLINTSGEAKGYTGAVPEAATVAVLEATIRFAEERYEGAETYNFLAMIQNKGIGLEQQLLASAGSAVVESTGAGKKLPAPYVEHLAALEVEFRLVRLSNGEELAKSAPVRAFYAGKWGGQSDTSHLPGATVLRIRQAFQQDEALGSQLQEGAARAQLAAQDPAEYLAQGYHLKQNTRVPLSTLDIRARVAEQVAVAYARKISPYEETASLEVQEGDAAAATLIRGNAYEEAIARIQSLPEQTAADSYNLGLAYEASGQAQLARQAYQQADQADPGNSLYQQALQRVR